MSYPQDNNTAGSPRISIILPVYNRESFLDKTLQSLINQTFGDFEVIIIDDGSTDHSVEIASKYKNIYPQKIYVFSQTNKGVSAARNLGIQRARGQYIAFIDSDDMWISSKLHEQVTYMEQTNCSICQTDEQWIRNGKKVNSMKKHTKQSGRIFFDSLGMCIVSPSAVMMKKEIFAIVGMFDENLPVVEDYDLWLRISLIYPIYLLRKKLIIKYGGHADQLSRKFWGMDRFRIYALIKLLSTSRKKLGEHKINAIYWHIKEKSIILANGALKRKKLIMYVQYKMYYFKYSLLWNLN